MRNVFLVQKMSIVMRLCNTVPFALIVGSITKSNGVELQKKVLQGLFCRCAIEGTIPRDREKTKARDTPNW